MYSSHFDNCLKVRSIYGSKYITLTHYITTWLSDRNIVYALSSINSNLIHINLIRIRKSPQMYEGLYQCIKMFINSRENE